MLQEAWSGPIAMVVTPTRPLLAAAALQRIGRTQEDPVLLLEAQITETVVPKRPWNLRGSKAAVSKKWVV